MKKVILTTLAGIFAVGVFAQSTTPQTPQKEQMKNLRQDTRDVRADKRAKNYDLNHGKYKAAKEENKNIRATNKGRSADIKDLKSDGVKHPQKRADRQIHRQNMRRK